MNLYVDVFINGICCDYIQGVLVQTTLWGNLILGPTARDIYKPETQKDTADDIMKFLLKKSKELVPSIDAAMVIHSFAGARAKSDRKDWIIEKTKVGDGNIQFYNVAGIDSPGLYFNIFYVDQYVLRTIYT